VFEKCNAGENLSRATIFGIEPFCFYVVHTLARGEGAQGEAILDDQKKLRKIV
jgi:hypothetical protein